MLRFLTSPFRKKTESPPNTLDQEAESDDELVIVDDDDDVNDGSDASVQPAQQAERTGDGDKQAELMQQQNDGSGDMLSSPRRKRRSSNGSVVSLMTTSSDDSIDVPAVDRDKRRAVVRSKTGINKRKRVQLLPRGTLYEKSEDEKILSYIVAQDGISRVKGRSFWQDAERDCASGYNRTWQSLKNRFIKSIVPNLDNFHCIADEDRAAIVHVMAAPAP